MRNTPVVATSHNGGGGGGGDWFDYSAISPLETSPVTPLTARGQEGGVREDRRSWGMGRRWEEAGMEEARVGERRSWGAGWGTLEDMGLGENRGSRGWMPVPSEERASSEGRTSNEG